ncbi:hypothetical protein [Pseudaeromonas paramecii]|uniref:Lipoprotein n=1 Tax=Pseudaeromonas paramecii TaxID=2138166 RepID=A0ABP8PZ45_9GAMM
MDKFVKVVLLIVFALSATGCATVNHDALTQDEALALKDKKVGLTHYQDRPDFIAQTAVNVQFGLLGLASAISSGNAMIKNNQVADPAIAIADKLAQGLAQEQQMQVVAEAQSVSSKVTDEALLGHFGQQDYVLDVKTLGWSSIYFPTDWDNYRVMYTARARLIEVQTGKIIADETCSHVPDYADTNQAPSYKALEDGSGLKTALAQSVEYCVNQIQVMAKLHAQTAGTAATN